MSDMTQPGWRHQGVERAAQIILPASPIAQQLFVMSVEQLRPDLFVTLRFNEAPMSVEAVRHRIRIFGGFVERHWLGGNWYKKPEAERSLYFAFIEGGEWSAHAHILWRLPRSVHPPHWDISRGFSIRFTELVRAHRIAPAGDVQVDDLRHQGKAAVIAYCLKHVAGAEEFLVSTEFRSRGRD